jgi:DNA polymerase III subunit gamma/tau
MSYQVIARKWRPQTFADLVGQEHVTKTLTSAIKNDRVAHAYIFSGARGVGKTTAARILAKGLNCAQGPTAEPCGVCDSCREVSAGTSLDVIEIDAASNRGIDQIRDLRDMVRYAPASSRSKVVILDEAHMLTTDASNALLKTLEEPPDRVIFVMATTEPENLEDTIRSRSQHFHFRVLTFSEITSRLAEIAAAEKLQIDEGALAVIARMAEGSMRDALSLLEQARAYCGENITGDAVRELLGVVPDDALAELVAAISEGSADRALTLVHSFQKEGRNLQHFCREAIRHLRNLLVAKVCGAESDLLAATPDQRPALDAAAKLFSEEDLTRFFQILLETDEDVRSKPDSRVHLEMGLLRLINAARLAPLEELLTEIKTGTGGAPPSTTTPPRRAAAASASSSGFTSAAPTPAPTISTPPASTSPASTSAPSFFAAPVPATSANFPPAVASKPTALTASKSFFAEAAPRPNPVEEKNPPGAAGSPLVHEPGSSPSTARSSAAAPKPAAGFPSPSAVAPSALTITPKQPTPESPSSDYQADHFANGSLSSEDLATDEELPAAPEVAAQPISEESENSTSLRVQGITTDQVSAIKSAIQKQQKFLGELLENSIAWELEGAELKIFFPTERKAFAEMIEGRDSLEKLRSASGNVLGRPIRVCARLEAGVGKPAPATRVDSGAEQLRARFESDPMVRSLLQRFGGKISEVRRAPQP